MAREITERDDIVASRRHAWISVWREGRQFLECDACRRRAPYQDSRNLPEYGCPGSEYIQELRRGLGNED